MASVNPQKFLYASAVQGGADAYVQSSFVTGLSGLSKTAYRVRSIIYETARGPGAANSNFEFAISRRTKAAMPLITDPNLLHKYKLGTEMTTSGQSNTPLVIQFNFSENEDLLIVEDPLYFEFDTQTTGLAQTAYLRIGYNVVTLSEVDRLELLASQLI